MARPILRLESVSTRSTSRRLIEDINFEVDAGQWLSVIGPNGAGKSTLIKCIAGLRTYEGRIECGLSGKWKTPNAKDVALVPQLPVIPKSMTVAEYVLLGRSPHISWFGTESQKDRDIAAEMVDLLNLTKFAKRDVSELSGGEIQRCVLARALTQQSPILLLDEPTSALDIGHQSEVLELVDHLRDIHELTVISVLHDLSSAARYSDRVALIDQGRIENIDTPSEVLDAQQISKIYGSDIRVVDFDDEILVLPPKRSRTETTVTP